MKILGTNVHNDKKGKVIEIIVPIEIEKGDHVTPISTLLKLEDWLAKVGEDTRQSISGRGLPSAGLEINAREMKYSLKMSFGKIWRGAGLTITDVLFILADEVWKEARRIYGD